MKIMTSTIREVHSCGDHGSNKTTIESSEGFVFVSFNNGPSTDLYRDEAISVAQAIMAAAYEIQQEDKP